MKTAIILLLLSSITAGAVTALVYWVRVLRRRREVRRAKKLDCVVFHDEIDEISPLFEGLRIFVFAMLFVTIPTAIIGVMFRNYAGWPANAIAAAVISPAYIMFVKRIGKIFYR